MTTDKNICVNRGINVRGKRRERKGKKRGEGVKTESTVQVSLKNERDSARQR
jgi:hypothetical protein